MTVIPILLTGVMMLFLLLLRRPIKTDVTRRVMWNCFIHTVNSANGIRALINMETKLYLWCILMDCYISFKMSLAPLSVDTIRSCVRAQSKAPFVSLSKKRYPQCSVLVGFHIQTWLHEQTLLVLKSNWNKLVSTKKPRKGQL